MTTALAALLFSIAGAALVLAAVTYFWVNRRPRLDERFDRYGRLPLFGVDIGRTTPVNSATIDTEVNTAERVVQSFGPPVATLFTAPAKSAAPVQVVDAEGELAEPTDGDRPGMVAGDDFHDSTNTSGQRAASDFGTPDISPKPTLDRAHGTPRDERSRPSGWGDRGGWPADADAPRPRPRITEINTGTGAGSTTGDSASASGPGGNSGILPFQRSIPTPASGAPFPPMPARATPAAGNGIRNEGNGSSAHAANESGMLANGIPGSMVEGHAIRFSVPAEGTLQFLPGRLEITSGMDVGREIRFVHVPGPHGTEVTFGRNEGPLYRHIQLRDQTVSREHARMNLLDGQWSLANLSRTNPVAHNGRELAFGERQPLTDGDRVEMGEVVFNFRSR